MGFFFTMVFYFIEKFRPIKIDNEITSGNEASNNKKFSLDNFWPAFKDGKRFIINLFLVNIINIGIFSRIYYLNWV